MDKFLIVDNLSKTYIGGYNGIKQVNFELEEGEKLAIVGGDGSGKTTILSVIAGLESMTEGKIILQGQDISNVKIKNRQIGYIDKSLQLDKRKKVKDIICYPLKLRKFDNNQIVSRLNEIATKFDLIALLDKKNNDLSYYQKVLVSLARLAIVDRKLYLIDDIFSSLHEEEIIRLSKIITNVFSEKTVIFAFSSVSLCEKFAIDKWLFLGYGTSLGVCDTKTKDIFLKTIEGAKIAYDRKVCCIPCELKDDKIIIANQEFTCNFKIANDIFQDCTLMLKMDKIRFDNKGQCTIGVDIDYVNSDNIGYFDDGFKIGTIYLEGGKNSKLGRLNFSFNIDDGILYDYESERKVSI